MSIATFNYKRAYIWELPVRLFHWVTALSIPILAITGLLIANPPAISRNVEATNTYLFGIIRAVHFITAYIFMGFLFFRSYWSFVGNKFASWKTFFPYTKKGLKNMIYIAKVDVLLQKDKDHKLSNISIGHNYLAAFAYFIMYNLFLFQIITGLALMSDTATWFLPQMFVFLKSWFGGDIALRYWHHLFTWIFIAFAVIHIYLVLYHDYIEARGETSAMISGYKFVRSERISETDEDIIEKASGQMWDGINEEEISK